MVNAHSGETKNILWRSFLLLPQHASPLIAQGWTLIHELYFYLVFALMLTRKQSRLPLLLAAWGILVLVGSMTLSRTVPTFDIIANPLTFEFIAGPASQWRPAKSESGGAEGSSLPAHLAPRWRPSHHRPS